MESIFTEIMKTVGAQTIIDMLKEAWGQCSSYIRADRNVEVLKSKMEELSKREEDVMIELQGKEVNQRKKRKREVELWLQKVKKAKDDVQSIEDGIETRSWISLSRYRSAMLLERKIETIVELQKKGEFPNGLVVDPMTEIGMELPTSSLIGQTTAHKTLAKIWNCLMDANVGKIGVHGMGGVGKTTIMKHINNSLKRDPHFDNVIWVTVSKALNLERLQNDIAKAIELRFSEDGDEDELRRSTAIYATLMRRKKFLLILDDMWEAFPLERIGIPEPNQSNGYKVVFTTRDLGVCRRMESDVDIKVEVLSNEEAWDLFKDKVGSDVVFSSKLEDVAKLVAQECGCLPLAIITVGRALRKNNDVREWENALCELRGSSSEIKDMETIVFKSLRFSYDRLRNDKIRACFLYCALYPEDFEIPREELIEYWMGEGLIEEKGNSATVLNRGHAVLNELRDACMLESVPAPLLNDGSLLGYWKGERVKMHDLLRDMAISITRSNPRFVVETGNELKDSLKDDEWVEDVERMSLMMNIIERLPSQPNCPNLSTLLLQENHLLHSVPNLFFHHMKGLRVLDLSYALIQSLPESITELENLRLLILYSCKSLQKVPSVRKLKALRVLDLCGTRIEELPDGMEEMNSLRRLDLSLTTELRTFQSGILSNLSSLEDLDMRQSNWEWSSSSADNVTAVSEELMSLTRLTRICIHFSDLSSFVSYVRRMKLPELENFHLLVGCPNDLIYDYSRCVEIYGRSPIIQEGSLLLPDKIRRLHFEECNLPRLSKLPCLSNAKELKICHIYSCDELEFILGADDGATILSTLETLMLRDLPNLRALCSGVVSPPTLTNLKILKVLECDGLRNLISFKLLQHLRNLEIVSVRYCGMVEEIIAIEDMEEPNIITLPWLEFLELDNLPKLKTIYTGTIIWSSLLHINISSCPHLKILPLSSHNHAIKDISVVENRDMEQLFPGGEENDEACYVKGDPIALPCLEELYLARLSALKRISTRPFICESLRSITVINCPRLKKLPLSVHNLPPTLECLSVRYCASLEEVIAGQDQDESKITLSKLKTLCLVDLPELKRICRQSLICSSLVLIDVKKCPQLRKLVSIDDPKSNPSGSIEGSAEWWGALEWDDFNTKTLLHPLFREEALRCTHSASSSSSVTAPTSSTSLPPLPSSPSPSLSPATPPSLQHGVDSGEGGTAAQCQDGGEDRHSSTS